MTSSAINSTSWRSQIARSSVQKESGCGDGGACENAIASAAQRMGRIDIVIHAGARLDRSPLDEVSSQMLQTMTSVNMWGSFFLARAAARRMARTGGGSIVLFSSQGAYTGGYAGSTVYSMTKAAVGALVKSLAREYAGRNVRVSGVAPAPSTRR